MPNWVKIKNEYVTTKISQRDLSKKHNVSSSTLTKRANREQWRKDSSKFREKVATKTEEKIIEKLANVQADYIIDIAMLNFKLANVVQKFIDDESKLPEARDVKAMASALKDILDIQVASNVSTSDNKPTININIPRGDISG